MMLINELNLFHLSTTLLQVNYRRTFQPVTSHVTPARPVKSYTTPARPVKSYTASARSGTSHVTPN